MNDLDRLKIKLIDKYQIVILKDMFGPVDVVAMRNPDKSRGVKVTVTAMSKDTTSMTLDDVTDFFGQNYQDHYVSFYEWKDNNLRFSAIRDIYQVNNKEAS